MSYRALRAHVDAAEARVVEALQRKDSAWHEMKDSARRSVTPVRILGTGFVSGLLLGISEPLARLTQGTRFVDLATSLVSLASALQAQAAADTATGAADVAHSAASSAEAAGEQATEAARELA